MLLLAKHHFDLSSVEFGDALALFYHRPLQRVPVACDGCGEPMIMKHALDCKRGGFMIQGHNQVRDAPGKIAAMAYRSALREPIVSEADLEGKVLALIADLGVHGVWQP